MKTIPLLLAAVWLAAPNLHAQFVADGATNTLSNVTNNGPSTVTVGTNGAFTLLVLSNNTLLNNSLYAVIGRNASARSNEVRLTSATARWTLGGFGELYVGSNGASSRLSVSDGGLVSDYSGTIGQRASSSNNAVLVTGPGSLWSGFFITLGNESAFNELTVSNGASVQNIGGSVGNFATASNNQVTVTGAGTLWTNDGYLFMGSGSSENRTTVSAGGWLACHDGYVGLGAAANRNTVLVTDSGSRWNNLANLSLGDSGSGNQMVVSNGASVFVGGDAVVGLNSNASANALVLTGPGTRFLKGSNTVLFIGSNGPFNRLVISNGATVDASSGELGFTAASGTNEAVVTGAGSAWRTDQGVLVGRGGAGNRLRIADGGSVSSGSGFIGHSAANNEGLLTGPGAAWTNQLDFYVGFFGSGNRLTISNGATLQANDSSYLGYNPGSGGNTATITGPGSVWRSADRLIVGDFGRSNRLTANAGAALNVGGHGVLGVTSGSSNNSMIVAQPGTSLTVASNFFVGSNGTFNLMQLATGASASIGGDTYIGAGTNGNNNTLDVANAGSVWTNQGYFRIGGGGPGRNLLLVRNGGVARGFADGYVGLGGPLNEVIVRDPGSLWDLPLGTLSVGVYDGGSLMTVRDGGVARSASGELGRFTFGSNALVTVTGAGSLWQITGALSVGASGSGHRLVIDSGGAVVTSSGVVVGVQPTSIQNQVTVNGGVLRATNASINAVLDVRRGTNVLNAGLIEVDRLLLTNAQGFFQFNGGTLITRGATISNGVDFVVGGSGSVPATWDVRGPSNTFVSANIYVGSNSAFNRILLTNGAQMTNATDTDIVRVGLFAGGNSNLVLLSGAGTRWSTPSLLEVGVVGASRNRLVISNGAGLTSHFINSIGSSGSSNNEVMVTGPGSFWDRRNSSGMQIYCGNGGQNNRLIVTNGGLVASTYGYIGTLAASCSNNFALVTGAGSTWSNQAEIRVGDGGSASRLLVEDDGMVTAGISCYVGFSTNSTHNRIIINNGTLLVTNATADALLEIRRGTNVLNAGLIEADILRLTNGPSGRMEVNGGTLAIKSSRVSVGPPVIIGNGVSPAMLHLAGNGTHDMSGTLGLIISSNATLAGSGSLIVQLQVLAGAQLVPGTSVGKISLSTPPFFSGTIVMELSKNGAVLTNDQIEVTGPVTYGGALTVSHLGPTALGAGDRFKLFNAAAYAGSFASVVLPPLPPGLHWVNNLRVDGSIEVFAPPPVGAGFALRFDGTNDFALVTHDSRLDAYPLIATVWFKTSQGTGEVGLINKYLAGSLNGWHVGLLNGEVRAWHLRDDANRVGTAGAGLNGGPVADNAWHHVAFTVDATGGRLFVDGFLRDTVAWTGTPGACTTTQVLSFARYPGGAGEFFQGDLEEATIWGFVTTTQSEIATNLNRGMLGSESGLVSYHRFNEGTGVIAANSASASGIFTRGVLQNGVTWTPGLVLRPAILTRSATAATVNSATLHGTSNPGLTNTLAWCEWGFTTNYGNLTPAQPLGSGGANTNFSVGLTGLTQNATYHFRAVASNSAGASLGADRSFAATGTNLLSPRSSHTATLLPNGKVLAAGGRDQNQEASSSAELFDPATGQWAFTSPMTTNRYSHTATVLPNGKVLVVGGENLLFATPHASAELYDPASGTWTPTGALRTNRTSHTATLLANGKVLVAGGLSTIGHRTVAELYDPATGQWTETSTLVTGRYLHTATLLPSGQVLVAGGRDTNSAIVASAELYDPGSGTWTLIGPMTTNRQAHTATLLRNGKVLVVGGRSLVNAQSGAELYDPVAGTWTATGAMLNSRENHTATLLPKGTVFATGLGAGGPSLYDPDTGTWAEIAGPDPRFGATATLLLNGQVMTAGGFVAVGPTDAVGIYVPTNQPAWTVAAPMTTTRGAHTATLLTNALVLVTSFGNSEIFNPSSGSWTNTGALITGRSNHTATLLPNGKVLAVGGQDGGFASPLASAELYTPSLGTWTNTGSLASNRVSHSATLLGNGKVLVAGGSAGGLAAPYFAAELYDPAAGTWTNTGAMTTNRFEHSATLLPNGKMLVAGGIVISGVFAPVTPTAELYDPANGTWTAVAPMTTSRRRHFAVLLPNGKVLVAGGLASTDIIPTVNSSAELFDPATGNWETTGSMTSSRRDARATLLPNGKVLVTGGRNAGNLSSAELYDPATGSWTATLPLGATRSLHTSTLLPNGRILVAGGYSGSGATNRVELYDVGLIFTAGAQPQILTVTSPLNLGGSLGLTGLRFRGLSGASGGNATQDSPTDYPIVQLRRLDNEQMGFLFSTGWSSNSFASVPVLDFQPGWAMATVYVSGIPSDAKLLHMTAPNPTAFLLTGMTVGLDGHFQFSFTNVPGAQFMVLSTTNVTLPVSNWTILDAVSEVSPGRFQFTDTNAPAFPTRFYRVVFP